MRKKLLLLFILTNTSIFAQYTLIPDANFENKLIALGIDNGAIDGKVLTSAINTVNELNVYYSNITDLTGIEDFVALKTLDCSYNQLTALDVSKNIALDNLACYRNPLKILDISKNIALKELRCAENQLSILDISKNTLLEFLDCSNNKLATLDMSSNSLLTELICTNNQLINLDVSKNIALKSLSCSFNQLTTLDMSKNTVLTSLYCDSNKLTVLVVNKTLTLEYLYCGDNQLLNLDVSKNIRLKDLRCNDNQLTALDVSKNTALNFLQPSNNYLTAIDVTKNTALTNLICSINQIITLDVSKNTELVELNCTGNQLTTLDLSKNTKLSTLYCLSNKLVSIFIKNGSNEWDLNFDKNSSLEYICTDEGQISSVQTKINEYGYTNCNVNSLCSFTPGGTFYTVKGVVKYDKDTNGCDLNDSFAPNIRFSITDGINSGSLISDTSGNYSIPVIKGKYTITPLLENPNYFSVFPTSLNVTFPSKPSPFTQDFCITPNGVYNDLEVTILPIEDARPGFDATYKLVYKNKGNTTMSGSISLTFDDAVLDYVFASPLVSSQITDRLDWDYSNLQPFETREITLILNVNSPMETPPVNIEDRLSFTAQINPINGDEKPVDNSSVLRQIVVGSFDPNDKTCLEGDIITPDLIGEYVHYLIRFENTGNYPAQNIVVKDLIDLTKFDIATLVPTEASHSYITKISEGNKVEFIFENINLPFDNDANDGYIAFKIRTLPTLAVGDSFENEANIYFDYNFPILTNKPKSTFTVLGTSDFEFSKHFNVYPNPTNSILNIKTKDVIELQSVSVYDISGKLIIAIPNAKNTTKIDVSNLKFGNYFIKINSNKGSANSKFIRE